jgi:Holliday junction resolvase RusA-like endonuclease
VIAFTVPGKPLGKGRPRFTRAGGGRAFTPQKTVNAESLIALFASQAMAGQAPFGQGEPLTCSVVATFAVAESWAKKKKAAALAGNLFPTGKPDGDNLAKMVGDALNGVAWHDDSQVVEWRIVKRYGEAPELRVEVSALACPSSSPLPVSP